MEHPDVLSITCQTFRGRRYYKGRGDYYRSTKMSKEKGKVVATYLHRDVYRANIGELPAGRKWHVHHKDDDKDNNRPENLELLSAKIHAAKHWTQERADAWRANLLATAIPASKEWHGSEEGLKWHSENMKKTWAARQMLTLTCSACGEQFEAKDTGKAPRVYCGNTCKMRIYRRTPNGRAACAKAVRRYQGKSKSTT